MVAGRCASRAHSGATLFFARTLGLIAAFLAAAPAAAGGVLFEDAFNTVNRLLTNEYAYWNPGDPTATISPLWEMDSGSFFARDGAGWTGVPDGVAPDCSSTNGTNSAIFRLNTKRRDFGDVAVSFSLLNRGLSSSSVTPAQDWDGLHIWLRYQSETLLYYASINRRDNTVVIKKKVTGGPSNGGTYHPLTPFVRSDVAYGAWQRVRASAVNNPDGSVTIQLFIDDVLKVSATDNGSIGGPPILGPGKVGIRGDNADLRFDDFTVTDLSPHPPAAPIGVRASPGDSQVSVSWQPVPGATSYNLYRSRFPGVTKANGYRIPNVSSPHLNTGFTNGTRYYMVVTAVSAEGESAESAEVSAVPVLLPPGAPTGVQAFPGDGRATISWSPVPGATSYNLYRSRSPGVTKTNGYRIPYVQSPYVNVGWVNGTSYYMVVTAMNAAGESVESAEVSVVPRSAAGGAAGAPASGVKNRADGVRAFPNPWQAARHQGVPLTFDGLGQSAVVRLFTLSGEPVATLHGSGSVLWELQGSDGNPVSSGTYGYTAEDELGRRARGVVAVIR